MTKLEERMVAAVRKDPKVGRGSCSAVDECMSDEEVAARLRDLGVTTSREAVAAFRREDRVQREVWGEWERAW
jgi:hypothetical protein